MPPILQNEKNQRTTQEWFMWKRNSFMGPAQWGRVPGGRPELCKGVHQPKEGTPVEVNENSPVVVVVKEVKGKGPYSKVQDWSLEMGLFSSSSTCFNSWESRGFKPWWLVRLKAKHIQ